MFEFTITMPQSAEDLGRWLERENVSLGISCQLGRYCVTLEWGKLHSYSDERGAHREKWELSRYDVDLNKALREAIDAALSEQARVRADAELRQAQGRMIRTGTIFAEPKP